MEKIALQIIMIHNHFRCEKDSLSPLQQPSFCTIYEWLSRGDDSILKLTKITDTTKKFKAQFLLSF